MDPTLRTRVTARLRTEASGYAPRMARVAKYILDNPSAFGLDPVRRTAEKAGVSTYTLVRMAKHLGFDSFDSLRAPFRHALTSTVAWEDVPDWAEQQRRGGNAGDVLAEAAINGLSVVQQSLAELVPERVEAAAQKMLAARSVYVLGMRAAYGLACYVAYVGGMALPQVRLVPGPMAGAADDLATATAEDLLVAITTDPYSRETIDACAFAQARGVSVLLIADSEIVAPGFRPELWLTASTNSTHHFACFSGLMAVIEALMAVLSSLGGPETAARIDAAGQFRAEQSAYWAPPKKNVSFS